MDTTTERISASASLPLVKRPRKSVTCNPFSYLDFFVGKSLRGLCCRAHSSNGFRDKSVRYDGMIVNNSVFCASPMAVEATAAVSTDFGEAKEVGTCPGSSSDEIGDGSPVPESSVSFSVSEETGKGEQSHCSSSCCSSDVEFCPPRIFLSMDKPGAVEGCEKPCLDDETKEVCSASEIEMMKERFAKLLLGEDMSGSGHGVCTALAISNAITNLSATLFGQIWRLEPLSAGKKSMWRREMEWFLSISDHIVELIPSCQKYPDGSKLEVMTCRPRSDLYINLPALRKLDNMLLDILDSFEKTEFWYLDQGNLTPEADGRSSFRRSIQRQEEKWWLPVPQLPLGGLEENSRKQLQHKRDSTNQILKAAMAINSITLADMEVPDTYLEYLPKNGRACLGDLLHRYLTTDEFSSECVLDCFDLSSEIRALEIANRVEASIHVWRRRTVVKPTNSTPRSHSKSSWKWENVKDLMVDAEKRESLADRAQTLLLCLKQRIPGLPQTTLDMCKIQYNKDIGKSILESYSRVLESLAFSIVARIDDLLYVDDMTRHSDVLSSMSKVRVIAQRSHLCSYSMPASGTPRRAALTTLSCSPKQRKSFSVRLDMSPLVNSGSRLSHIHHGLAVRKLFTDLLGTDGKENSGGNRAEESKTNSNVVGGVPVPQMQDSLEGEGK